MTNYENDIMDKLQGDTPKEKYEYLLSISYSGKTAKQCAEITKHFAIEFATWIVYNEWGLITEDVNDYYKNASTGEDITPEQLYSQFEESRELPEHGTHLCVNCNWHCSCDKQPCSCCNPLVKCKFCGVESIHDSEECYMNPNQIKGDDYKPSHT